MVTAAVVVSGCSPSGGGSVAERTSGTTATTITTTTTPPVAGEQRLCAQLASIDLTNPQQLLTIELPRTTDRAFDVPSAFLAAKLTALESALNAGTDPAYPTQEAATAVTRVLDACREGGYL